MQRTDPTFDPNQELQHFVQALLLRREYEKPYELPPQMIRCADALVEQIQVDNEDQLVYSSQAKKLDMRVFEDALLQFYKSRSVTKVSWDDARENAELKSMAVEILQRAVSNHPFVAPCTLADSLSCRIKTDQQCRKK